MQYLALHGFDVCHRCGFCHVHSLEMANVKGAILKLPKNHVPAFCGNPKTLPESFTPQAHPLYCPYKHCHHSPFKSKAGLTNHVNYKHKGWSTEPVDNEAGEPVKHRLPDIDLTQFGYDLAIVEALNKSIQSQAAPSEEQLVSVLGPRDVVQTLSTIYIGLDLALDTPDAPRLKTLVDEHIREVMTHILNYLVMSSLGEARHLPERIGSQKSVDDIGRLSPLARWLAASLSSGDRFNRTDVWMRGLLIADVVGFQATLRVLEELFLLPVWGVEKRASYGGLKWAQVCAHALKFIDGYESPIMALDSIVDIVHNGGWALNKYYHDRHTHIIVDHNQATTNHSISLQDALDTKQESALPLLPLVCIDPWLKEAILAEEGLIYRLHKQLPTTDSNLFFKFKKSEIASRMGLGISASEESKRFAHLECIEGFWPPYIHAFSAWIHAFGKGEVDANRSYSDDKGYRIWVEFINRRNAPPRYDDLTGWCSAVPSTGRTGWKRNQSSWLRKLVEALDAGLAPKEAKKLWRAELSAPEPPTTEPKTVKFSSPPIPSRGTDGSVDIYITTTDSATDGNVWLSNTERVA